MEPLPDGEIQLLTIGEDMCSDYMLNTLQLTTAPSHRPVTLNGFFLSFSTPLIAAGCGAPTATDSSNRPGVDPSLEGVLWSLDQQQLQQIAIHHGHPATAQLVSLVVEIPLETRIWLFGPRPAAAGLHYPSGHGLRRLVS